MLQIVVCEDNPVSLNNLAGMIERVLKRNQINGKIVCKATDVVTVENYIKHNEANLFFLDIDLKTKENGYNLAEKIRENFINAYIVFVTCHFEYVLHAFKVQSFDFLAKPVTVDVIEQCLLRVYKYYLAAAECSMHKDKCIDIKSGSILYKIKIKDIVYIERLGFKTIIYTVQSVINCYMTLETLEKMLQEDHFIRCHKSYIVNKLFIREIHFKEKLILFETGQKCCIGPKYKKELL